MAKGEPALIGSPRANHTSTVGQASRILRVVSMRRRDLPMPAGAADEDGARDAVVDGLAEEGAEEGELAVAAEARGGLAEERAADVARVALAAQHEQAALDCRRSKRASRRPAIASSIGDRHRGPRERGGARGGEGARGHARLREEAHGAIDHLAHRDAREQHLAAGDERHGDPGARLVGAPRARTAPRDAARSVAARSLVKTSRREPSARRSSLPP
jgi:hypothetical protein